MALSKYDIYYYYDSPVPYRNLLIYPATMRDYFKFQTCGQCLLVDKNSVPDPKIISMSYLEYLFYETLKDKSTNPYLLYFRELLRIVLRKKDDDPVFNIGYKDELKRKNPFFVIDDQEFNSDDFEEIKHIICEYNELEIPDDTISKEVRDKMDEALRLKQKESGNKSATLEELMICATIETPYRLEDIYGLSIRKFNKLLERINKKIDYQILTTASMSGFVEFKDKSILKHWMSEFPKNKYHGTLMDAQKLNDRINFKDKTGNGNSNFE